GAAATPASSASPMTTSTSPTWIFWPAAVARRKTTPARGAGISTTALSVSTSTSGWSGRTRSPSWTSQRTISPSWIPSPTSGKRNSSAIQTSKGQDAADGLDHTLRRRQVVLFQLRQRKHRVKTGDALDRGLQRQERFFIDLRHNLGAQATGARRFVHDHSPPGLFHRGDERRHVQGGNGAHINALDANTLTAHDFCSLVDLAHHRAPADHRHIAAGLYHTRLPNGHGVRTIRHVLPDGAIDA